ncbi:MAG: hypothetical protein ABL958_06750, partial [Bdellovibrionia bacterium]
MANDESRPKEPAKTEISERDIRILFVTQKETALASTMKFLTKRQWRYSVVESLKDAFEKLQGPEKPTHVLISFSVPMQ